MLRRFPRLGSSVSPLRACEFYQQLKIVIVGGLQSVDISLSDIAYGLQVAPSPRKSRTALPGGEDIRDQALFISHASPEDNAFTLWLGAKLTALGYEVFADILRLKGGDDWERILETAIRDRAAKFLLAATPHGVQKQSATSWA